MRGFRLDRVVGGAGRRDLRAQAANRGSRGQGGLLRLAHRRAPGHAALDRRFARARALGGDPAHDAARGGGAHLLPALVQPLSLLQRDLHARSDERRGRGGGGGGRGFGDGVRLFLHEEHRGIARALPRDARGFFLCLRERSPQSRGEILLVPGPRALHPPAPAAVSPFVVPEQRQELDRVHGSPRLPHGAQHERGRRGQALRSVPRGLGAASGRSRAPQRARAGTQAREIAARLRRRHRRGSRQGGRGRLQGVERSSDPSHAQARQARLAERQPHVCRDGDATGGGRAKDGRSGACPGGARIGDQLSVAGVLLRRLTAGTGDAFDGSVRAGSDARGAVRRSLRCCFSARANILVRPRHQEARAMTKSLKQVRVSMMNAIHDLPLLVARDESFFKDEGLDVDIIRTPGSGQRDSDHQALRQNIFERTMDALYDQGQCDQFRMCEWGVMKRAVEAEKTGHRPPKIVPLASPMPTSALATDPKPRTYNPDHPNPQPIAVSPYNGSHFTTLKLLEGFLKREQIKWVFAGTMKERLEALSKGEVAAASLMEPWISVAEKRGMRVLMESHSTRSEAAGGEPARPNPPPVFLAPAPPAQAIDKDPWRHARHLIG